MNPAPELLPLAQFLYFGGMALTLAVIVIRMASLADGPLAPLAEIRPQAAFIAAMCVGVSFLLGDDAYAYAAVFAFLAAAFPLAIYRRPKLEPLIKDAKGVARVLTWNAGAAAFGGRLRGGSPLSDGAVKLLRGSRADLVVLQEATATDAARFLSGEGDYSALTAHEGDGPALRIFAHTDLPARLLSGGAPKLQRVRIDLPDTAPLIIFAVHAPPPWATDRSDSFTMLIEAIVKETKAGRRAALVGDLNASPFGVIFARLKEEAGLRDPRRGRRPIATWPIPVFGPGLQIDHILVGPDVAVVDHQIGPMQRSDHTPIWADLRW
ncbi:MAG: endonuclease/exonuclease/phosphatase family protein [Pseudomonadota bacterium]